MFNLAISLGVTIMLLAFFAEYVDSTFGMGYGTSLTPILMVMGFTPLQIVPAILMTELVSGLLAALIHSKLGNVNFQTKDERGKISEHLSVALVLAFCSVIGTIAAVFIALNIPSFYVKLYIGVLVLAMGIYLLVNRKKTFAFSWKRIIGLGMLASFNKGISGGGYGPIVTGGQILSGVNSKNAIAITSLAEALTCAVGVLVYHFSNAQIDMVLVPYLMIGSVFSVPFSGITIKKLDPMRLHYIIGIITVCLGCFTLYKIL